MWSNIGNIEEHRRYLDFLPSGTFGDDDRGGASSPGGGGGGGGPGTPGGANSRAPQNDALYLYADCHSTMKGLFFGLLFTVAAIIGIVIFFILSESCDAEDMSRHVNNGFEASMFVIMIIASIWVRAIIATNFAAINNLFPFLQTYWKLASLDVNPHPISLLDDLLLYMCIPSFFLYAVVHMLPMVTDSRGNWADLLCDVLLVLQMLVQTPMIMDGLRRCSDSAKKQVRGTTECVVIRISYTLIPEVGKVCQCHNYSLLHYAMFIAHNSKKQNVALETYFFIIKIAHSA